MFCKTHDSLQMEQCLQCMKDEYEVLYLLLYRIISRLNKVEAEEERQLIFTPKEKTPPFIGTQV